MTNLSLIRLSLISGIAYMLPALPMQNAAHFVQEAPAIRDHLEEFLQARDEESAQVYLQQHLKQYQSADAQQRELNRKLLCCKSPLLAKVLAQAGANVTESNEEEPGITLLECLLCSEETDTIEAIVTNSKFFFDASLLDKVQEQRANDLELWQHDANPPYISWKNDHALKLVRKRLRNVLKYRTLSSDCYSCKQEEAQERKRCIRRLLHQIAICASTDDIPMASKQEIETFFTSSPEMEFFRKSALENKTIHEQRLEFFKKIRALAEQRNAELAQ